MKAIMKVSILLLGMLLLTGCNVKDVEYFGESDYGIKENEIVYTHRESVKSFFYTIIPLQDVSKETFEVIEREDDKQSILAQDNDQVYCAGLYITNVDRNSFRTILENEVLYAVDNNGVYLVNEHDCMSSKVGETTELEKIEGADPQTIQNVYKELFKDSNNYYLMTSSDLKSTEEYQPLTFLDYESFDEELAIRSDLDWLKDHHKVIQKSTNYRFNYTVIADDESNEAFVSYLGDTKYLRVNQELYYGTDSVSSIKIDDVRIVNGDIIADGTKVYNFGKQILVEDPATFEHIEFDFYKDSKAIYSINRIEARMDKIDGINLETAVIVNPSMMKDNAKYFYRSKKVEELDYESFEELSNGLYKDKNGYYYQHLKIPVENLESFKYCNIGFGYDEINIYEYSELREEYDVIRIQDADERLNRIKKSYCDE